MCTLIIILTLDSNNPPRMIQEGGAPPIMVFIENYFSELPGDIHAWFGQ